ncbi:MAG: lauroyl acyltransferase [Alphaproteobacteria bacterium]|nr:lauroyl acyltransferase [Alphaproteobacteria bacterium]
MMKRYLRNFIKRIFRHPLEAIAVYSAYLISISLPLERASAAFGWLARNVTRISGENKIARRNLNFAFPEKSAKEINLIIKKVWDNFGRIMGEYGHLKNINIYNDSRFEVIGADIIDQLRDDGKPAIIFAAHLASWEVAIMAAKQRGLKLAQLYRTFNNPIVDWLIMYVQRQIGHEVLTKGSVDARKLLAVLKRGEHLFMLVDQKHNGGIPVPFLGRNAMTAPAAGRLALQLDCPLVPARVERLGGFKFRITFYPPLTLPKIEDKNQAVFAIMSQVNDIIGSWVKAQPEQWLWLHNRWPK